MVRIISGWSSKPAGRTMRPAGFAMLLAAALLTGPAAHATAGTALAPTRVASEAARPQWFAAGDDRAAMRLLTLLQTSDLDGINPETFKERSLRSAIRSAASGDMKSRDRASKLLDRALASYVASLRLAKSPEWIVNDREAVPGAPSAAAILAQAAAAPSLEEWLDTMPFMHPAYAELRSSLIDAEARGDEKAQQLLRLNLERVRLLPAGGRFVLVNTAAQRLFIYDGGKVVDTMRVVVGKSTQQTPMMAAMIRFANLNPYWNVPSDLAAERVAPNVVKEGLGYLRSMGYVVLSDWGANAVQIDPSTIDWNAVAAGRVQVRIRQNPGPSNAMGRMKFMFPNPQGIYLHDTPNKELLHEDARLFSGGCVRVEDAPRLAKWLYGHPMKTRGAGTEQKVELDTPVPVYLAYLTAMPSDGQVVFYDDIYGRDHIRMAESGRTGLASR